MKKGGRITKKRIVIISLCIVFGLFWSYKEEVFASYKPIDQYGLNKELKNKSIEVLTHNEMKKGRRTFCGRTTISFLNFIIKNM